MTDERKIITVPVDIRYDIDGLTLAKAISALQKLGNEHGYETTIDLRINGDGYSEWPSVMLKTKRPETDEEMHRRRERDKKISDEQEERDRRDFERLSKKFKT